MKTFAMIAAALSLLTGCVVEDRVIIRDSHPGPLYYGYGNPYWRPAPSYWYGRPRFGHHHHGGFGYRPYRW